MMMKTATYLVKIIVVSLILFETGIAQHHQGEAYAPALDVSSLPAPPLMSGIGTAQIKITTKSELAQKYFNQGLNLLHALWDVEAYRAFREAVRNDENCAMCYWGIYNALGQNSQEMSAERTAVLKKAIMSQVIFAVPVSKDLQKMAETEREFSATAVKEGFRDSFIKFFADDGIGFGPEPQRTKEVLSKTTPQPAPRKVVFRWQPYFCDMSLDGDLGYSTGPVLYEDVSGQNRPPRHGLYFSVWQKQTDRSWKVAVDMGTSTPQAVASQEVNYEVAKNPNGIDKSAAKKLNKGNFDSLDTDFSAEIAKTGLVSAYNAWLSDEFRVHRNGMLPILTKGELKKYLDAANGKISFKQLGGKISNLKDIAFTYGSLHLDGSDSPKGYYVHVWRRNKAGNWKLAADIFNELPTK
jgi:ketosteroid isomerase-like protein